jgi:hypothetical protein
MILWNLLAVVLGLDALLSGLVSDLGANDFRRRERATVVLRQLSPLGYHRLLRATAGPDPEVRRRARELVRPVQAEALRQAARRQVVLRDPNKKELRFLGTLLVADGSQAYVLTSTGVFWSLRERSGVSYTDPLREGEVTVEWDGEKYLGCWVRGNNGLSLLRFPCRRTLTPLRLADASGRGCWWNGRLELDTPFQEDMELVGSGSTDLGCGVFTLDQARLQVMLGGVNCNTYTWPPNVGGVRIRLLLKGAIPPGVWKE